MTRTEIEEWLVEWAAAQLGMSPDEIELDRSFASYGLDDEELVAMVDEVEDYFEERLDPRLLKASLNVGTLTQRMCAAWGVEEEEEAGSMNGGDDMGHVLRDLGYAGHM